MFRQVLPFCVFVQCTISLSPVGVLIDNSSPSRRVKVSEPMFGGLSLFAFMIAPFSKCSQRLF